LIAYLPYGFIGVAALALIPKMISKKLHLNRASHEKLALTPGEQVERLKGLVDSVFVMKELEQDSYYEQYVCYAVDTNRELHVVIRSPDREHFLNAGKTLAALYEINFEDGS
jgi:hypothetical protein